ncbi:LysR family transcriptional regulator [Shimia sp. CNT1-13L.2]|uniref:LysR family transcriptional regulator n=1 Tax=Shimia sp. CNT1-13L.2 TaxID=2959663 RepID=UPI0020CC7745|nr:LysR family transcriptional regulator [Shimia sp. CNT1-13L.2]MCP9483508.1 LysR family transcriptional regulator [Shimia sp. CNT1-13L.2]
MAAQWDDLRTVMHLVRGGSLAAAAKALGVNYTTVSRRIARAETALGVTLFERLADGYRPTEDGLAVARHAAEMEAREHDLMRDLTQRDARLEGRLVVTAPQLMIGPLLGEVIDRFMASHPNVDLHLRASNDLIDLGRREADLAIRISNDPGDSLKGLRLTAQQSAAFAAPRWAERLEADPETLVDWIVYDALGRVPGGIDPAYANHRMLLQCNDMAAMVGMAQAGLGVVRMPLFLGRVSPGLVQVPVLAPQPYADVWLVAHPDIWSSAKVAAFRECLVPQFRARQALFLA